MTLRRPPTNSSRLVALDYEVAQEQASALGRAGRALETALKALSDYEGTGTGNRTERAKLVQDASDALWCFMVQRESCGLRDPRPVLRDYRIPAEVQNRMGIFGGRRRGKTRLNPILEPITGRAPATLRRAVIFFLTFRAAAVAPGKLTSPFSRLSSPFPRHCRR